MNALIYRICCLVLLVGIPGLSAGAALDAQRLAHLEDRCPTVYMAAVYINGVSDLSVPRSCPRISFDPGDPRLLGRPMDPGSLRLHGTTYYPSTDVIVLSPMVDLDTPVGLSHLIHQLVHAQQFALGHDAAVPCRNALEAQAFAIQAMFLEDSGEEALAERMRLHGSVKSRCSSRPDYMR